MLKIERDLRAEILAIVPTRTPQARTALEQQPTLGLLVTFFNWRDRLVHAHRRDVLRAHGFNDSSDRSGRRGEVDKLLGKLAAGVDVSRHLSRDIAVGAREPGKPGQRRRDLDLLLNEWGIHHLHLDEADPTTDRFPRGSSHLLFAIITGPAAYALTVGDHDMWTDQSLVEIAVRTWPEAALFVKLRGATPPLTGLTNEQREHLRQSRTNAFLTVDGAEYMPRTTGISSAGNSSRNSILSIRVGRILDGLRNNWPALAVAMKIEAEALGIPWPGVPDIRVRVIRGDDALELMLVEEKSRTMTPIERWPSHAPGGARA